MKNFERLLTSVPIDKKAAIVSRCREENETEYDKLKIEFHNLEKAMKFAKNSRSFSSSDIKEMGKEMQRIINELKKCKGNKKKIDRHSIETCFLDICYEELPRSQFYRLYELAKAKAAKGKSYGQTS